MSNATANNARYAMESGEYWNNKGKRQPENLLEISGKCGYFIDEIVKLYSKDLKRYLSFWLYHGNAIAMFDHEEKMYFYTSAGWKSNTTKDRLNNIGANITQKNFEWFRNGEKWTDDEVTKEFISTTLRRITGNMERHYFCLDTFPDTGTWEDSPYRSETVEEKLQNLERISRTEGIKTYRGHDTTQNVFCMYRSLYVRGCDFEKAKEVLEG